MLDFFETIDAIFCLEVHNRVDAVNPRDTGCCDDKLCRHLFMVHYYD